MDTKVQMYDSYSGKYCSVSLLPEDMGKSWWLRLDCVSDSGRHYVISLSKHQKCWACSCPGYTRRKIRTCSHLRACRLDQSIEPPTAILDVITPMKWFAVKALLETWNETVS